MKRFHLLLIILLLSSSCATLQDKIQTAKENRAGRVIERQKAKFPQLFAVDTSFVTRKDTIIVIKDAFQFDTVVLAGVSDTIVITKENVITKVKILRDTKTNEVIKYKVETLVLSDTVLVERIDTVFTINTEIVTKTETVKEKHIPIWVWVVIGVLFILFFMGIYYDVKELRNG